jgi:hypothetical protein
MVAMLSFFDTRCSLRWIAGVLFVPVFVAGLLVTLASALTLVRGGEVRDLDALVSVQQRTGQLYNSPARDNRAYKLALVAAREPRTIVVGSSRAMLFRAPMFAESFVNAGGTVSNLLELVVFLRALGNVEGLRRVIVIVDYWWFDNDRVVWTVPETAYRSGRADYAWGVNLMTPAFVALDKGVVAGVEQLIRGALARLPMDRGGIVAPIGLTARLNGAGYAPDGSYYYGASLYCRHRDADVRGGSVRRDADRRWEEFSQRTARSDGLDALVDTVARLRDDGVRVQVVAMPLAPALYARLRSHPAFVQITRLLNERFPGFLDFHDPGHLHGLTDVGFIDATHPGERVYAAVAAMLDGEEQRLGSVDAVLPETGEIGAAFARAFSRGDLQRSGVCVAG